MKVWQVVRLDRRMGCARCGKLFSRPIAAVSLEGALCPTCTWGADLELGRWLTALATLARGAQELLATGAGTATPEQRSQALHTAVTAARHLAPVLDLEIPDVQSSGDEPDENEEDAEPHQEEPS